MDSEPEAFRTERCEDGNFGLLELISAADRMTGSGKAEISLELYELWLRHHPADPLRYVAYFNQGTLLSQTGHTEQAATAFAEAIGLAPTFLPAYVNAGLALERLGRRGEAINCWLQAVDRVVPIDGACIGHKTQALRHLARVFKSIGDVGRSEEALRRCLDIDPHQRDVIQHWIAVREMQCKWPVVAPWGTLTQSGLMAAFSPLGLAIHTNDPAVPVGQCLACF